MLVFQKDQLNPKWHPKCCGVRPMIGRTQQQKPGRPSRMTKHVGLMAGASLLLGGAAMADTVELAFVGMDLTYTAKGTYPGGSYYAYAGISNLDVKGWGAFKSFCVDLYDYAGEIGKYHEYELKPLSEAPQSFGNLDTRMGEAGVLAVAKLWDLYYEAAQANLKTAAALQVAIWEVVNEKGAVNQDGRFSLAGGRFTATGGNFDKAQAQKMLDSILGYNPAHQLPRLFAFVNTTDATHYQDFLGVPDGGVTLALLGISTGALAFFARRSES